MEMEDSDSDLLPPAATGVRDTEMEAEESITDSDISASLGVAMGLPVTASLGPVGPLLRQLHLRQDQDGEIQKLRGDLDRLCISLMNHSEAEVPSYRVKCWMSEIRELCYDTKNYMDDAPFLLKQDEDDQLTPQEKEEIAKLRIMELEDRVIDASNRTRRYKIYPQNINKARFLSVARRRLQVLYPELIGRRSQMDELPTLLCNGEEKQQLEAVSLVGPEGVGKTTLAKELYRETGGKFECRAFVRVSPKPDMRRLLASIFTQIQRQQPQCSSDAQDLITSIFKYLSGKRYLIIIDDLWSISVWDVIRHAFPDGDRGSRIITTTQFEDVASACCSYKPEYICKMEPLEEEQSKTLLCSIVFGTGKHDSYPNDFISVSDEIVRKCGGLPSLTINVASLLPTPSEINLQQWQKIRDALPPTLLRNPSSEGIKEVINFTYNDLSPEVKTCLLYLAMYPEGYTVGKHDLVKQWVVEGFTGEGQDKEKIAHEYFDELVSRGMIQAVNINYRGVLSCTLHHSVHDLIVKKSVEGNFIMGVDHIQSAVWLPDKVRRMSVQFGGARSARLPAGISLPEVRSLAYFGFYGCADFIEKCNLLRVLTLHVWADDWVHQSEERPGISPSGEKQVLTYDLSGFSKLLPLRYLKVAFNITVKLPDEIQDLRNLETLEVDATIAAIPSGIGELSRLSSLKIAVRELSAQDVRILQALQALSALSLHVLEDPVGMIVFDKGGFSVLKYFKFRCSVPSLQFEAGSMPDLQNLNLSFNAREANGRGIVPVGIEHLPGLKEINAEIWGADTDVGSTFRTAISNHPSNPRIDVQLVDSWIFYGDTATSTGTNEKEYMSEDDDKGEEEKKQAADSSVTTLPPSKRMSTLLGSSVTVQGAAKRPTLEIETDTIEVTAQSFAYDPEIKIDGPEEIDIEDSKQSSPMNKQTEMNRQSGRGDEKKQADIRIYTSPGSSPRVPDSGFNHGMTIEATDLTLHLLESITNEFSERLKIGSGGYGAVYRAVLNGCEIAVKKLHLTDGSIDDTNFTNEFRQLMKVQHENIIRLIGYCYEIKHKHTEKGGEFFFSKVIDRALCFEYMQGGSLANHMSDESCIHDWATTFKIIKGTCEGLHYLHRGRGQGQYIYHLDLKPANILLDKDLIPKIADFGLSRLFGESKTHKTSSQTEGTVGFMAPEYTLECAISPKNDVFSLGVIIFFLVAGRQGYIDYCESRSCSPRQEFIEGQIRQEFIERVQEYWKRRMEYTGDEIDLLGVKICIELAMSCVEKVGKDRPCTKEIIDELHNLDAQMKKMSNKDTQYIELDPSQELCFPFKPKMNIPCCLKLINKVDSFIAFNIRTNKRKYSPWPSKGILPPFSKCNITVTLQAQEEAPPNMLCLDNFYVQSARVSRDFTSQKITQEFLEEATEVDEVRLPIAYVALE